LTDPTAEILLVRAAEETRAVAIAPEALVDAHAGSGPVDDDQAWLGRRAALLLDGPLAALRPLASMTQAAQGGLGVVSVGAAIVGLAANYLGPSAKIHVLVNPIALLIVWNLAAYAAVGALGLRRRRPPGRGAGLAPVEAGAASLRAPAPPVPGLFARLFFGRLLPGLWLRLHRGVLETRARASDLARVGRRFWSLWMQVAAPSLAPLVRRALHAAAIGVAAGAVAGMYGRGLFFEYNVVWRSTFITDTDSFLSLIRAALGPAALVLGHGLPTQADAALLITERGAPAAPWIHLYAVSALLFIVLPRTCMLLASTWQARRLLRRTRIDLHDPYYQDLLEKARRLQVAELEDAIEVDVRNACDRFGEELASFVCERLFDHELAPRIRAFRRDGGSIAGLERDLSAACEGFRPTLQAHVPVAQRRLERDLSAHIAGRVGGAPSLDSIRRRDVAGSVVHASGATSGALSGSLGHGLADTVSTAVGAALVVAGGTVSGGFGEAIGVAVLVGVLETGPVGWVVGALLGLLAAGAGWWLGRERLTESLRGVSLPATVVRTVLWESRMERLVTDGRERCAASVRELVQRELGSLTPEIADEIWRRLKPVLGEQQRPRPAGEQ
jgi:hypothetical protein